MKKSISLLGMSFVLIALLTPSVFAKNQVTDTQVYQLMDKSGVTRTIEGLPLQMQAMGQQMALTAKDPANHKEFMQVFTSSLKSDVMLEKIAKYISNNISHDDMQKMLTWLESDIATRVIKAELQSAEPDFQQNLMRYMAQLQSTPPSQERTNTIINYVVASGVAEQSYEMIMSMIKNMFTGLKMSQVENMELTETLDTQLKQMALTMKPALEQQMIMTSYYIYQDLSNEEISVYSEFFQQDLGKKYLSLLMGAVGNAMNHWGTNMIAEVSKIKQ